MTDGYAKYLVRQNAEQLVSDTVFQLNLIHSRNVRKPASTLALGSKNEHTKTVISTNTHFTQLPNVVQHLQPIPYLRLEACPSNLKHLSTVSVDYKKVASTRSQLRLRAFTPFGIAYKL